MNVFISATWDTYATARELFTQISASIPMVLQTVDYNDYSKPVVSQLIDVIQRSDLIIAEITQESPHIYYEIGIAHGNNKPVILISRNNNVNIVSTLFVKLYVYEPTSDGLRNLAFRIEYLLNNEQIFKSITPLSQTAIAHQNSTNEIGRIKQLISSSGLNQVQLTEILYQILSDLEGFTVSFNAVVAAEYDLIIWNASYDSELNSLGTPIPVEIKSQVRFNMDMVYAMAAKARLHGFRSYILFIGDTVPEESKEAVKTIAAQFSINILIVDLPQLEKIDNAQDLYVCIKSLIRKGYQN